MKLNVVEISEILKEEILKNIDQLGNLEEVGRVITVGDGIARVYGIKGVQVGEMVIFASGVHGLALNLEVDSVGVVVIGPDSSVQQGDVVKRTGEILKVPVGKELLGRVVDGLAEPIDGKGANNTKLRHNI